MKAPIRWRFMLQFTPELENLEALHHALLWPSHLCRWPQLLWQVLSMYTEFMGENKWDTMSCTKKCEKKGRKIGLLHHQFSTMNWWNNAMFHSDTTDDFVYGLSCKTDEIQNPALILGWWKIRISDCLKAQCLTELPNPRQISRRLTSMCFSIVQHGD